ncbi:FAD-binding monooxygenase [Sphaerisporangium siamense]|uniref:2-polyprenyl-6-methoxyphenol hydroxylase-like FAD-dependent oxidoreductase n=1 Tax=Sphaerisporangium siamense TaxID=795645 RepID=A0A7W7DDE3_9ACTN|nr:FAD-dependent monooxygenase [Sphaerisporangium siamense]MBB4704551.1 2-polyprenyl-6-methoxyphenol hydroxylase-like FAD-dependent oxidoreductase [Sphaerisporangium siamense]GII86163.1 FAD-binding monooxygenase [Sphaerisporangium siamense]
MSAREAKARAVVIGGGIGGLLAAVALSDAFDETIVVERDTLVDGQGFRRGVPQSPHPHALLSAGAEAMESLLPGLAKELHADGAPTNDLGDVLMCAGPRQSPRLHLGTRIQTFTRTFLEEHLRARVRAHPRVRICDGTSAAGLIQDTAADGVAGVQVQDAEGVRRWEAGLVVDAGGRGSPLRQWLPGLRRAGAIDQVVEGRVAYSTVWLDYDGPLRRDRPGIYEVGSAARYGRGAGVVFCERDRALIMLYGRGGDMLARSAAEFADAARTLRNPAIDELVGRLTPGHRVYRYTRLPNLRHRYDRVRAWPAGLLVVGDALCVFNPVYGQGMTVAALQATELRRHAAALCSDPATARSVQRRLFARTGVPWRLAVSADTPWVAAPPLHAPLLKAALGRVNDRAVDDPAVRAAFLKTMQMSDPLALLRPRALTHLLRP